MNPLPAWARGYDRLWYANANAVREGLVALVAEAPEPPHALVLELDQDDADVQALDTLGELAAELARHGVALRLAAVRALIGRSGLDEAVSVAASVDAALAPPTARAG